MKEFSAQMANGEFVTNGDWVHADGDKHLRMVVTAICFRRDNVECELSWFAEGNAKTSWIELWRLSPEEVK